MVEFKDDTEKFISKMKQQNLKAVQAYVKEISLASQATGKTPVYTGKTLSSSAYKATLEGSDAKGHIEVGQGVDYIGVIYPKGGIVPTGTPNWINATVEQKGGAKGFEEKIKESRD